MSNMVKKLQIWAIFFVSKRYIVQYSKGCKKIAIFL